jgi:hypothetical protein
MIMLEGSTGIIGPYLRDTWSLDLTGTPAWTYLGTAPGYRAFLTMIYDPVRDRLVTYGGLNNTPTSEIATFPLKPGGPWQVTTLVNSPPPRYGHSAIYDPIRDRMLVFGGAISSSVDANDTWALSFSGPSMTWSRVVTDTAPPPRSFHTAVYDPAHDRMIVFGGTANDYPYGSVWALSLGANPAWTQLSPQIIDGSRTLNRQRHSSVYWPDSDQMWVFGGRSDIVNAELWSLDLSGGLVWQIRDWGDPPTDRTDASVVLDTGRNRLLLFGGFNPGFPSSGRYYVYGDCWEWPLGPVYAPAVSCPERSTWNPGSDLAPSYRIHNSQPFAQSADWRLETARSWPGLPLSGSLWLEPGADSIIAPVVSVPDSAAPGWNVLTLKVMFRSVPWFTQCSDTIEQEVGTGTSVALVDAQARIGRVRLTWFAPGRANRAVRVERSRDGTLWTPLGSVAADASGFVTYEDTDVRAGDRLAYRIRIADDDSRAATGEVWIEVPPAPALSLDGLRPSPADATVSIGFSLASESRAILEVFDVSGRRVGRRDLGAPGAGAHVVPFSEARRLPSGVYWFRLSQDGRSAAARGVISR